MQHLAKNYSLTALRLAKTSPLRQRTYSLAAFNLWQTTWC